MLMRGSNKLVLDEADRSVHDALCVIRSIVKKRYMIAGGGAPEAECALRLTQWAKTLTGESSLSPSNLFRAITNFPSTHCASGVRAYCVRGFAEALEVIPYTLAENAGT